MDWRGKECAAFIEGIGFPQYRNTFALNMTGKQLKLLETKHLSRASITDFNHQRIILKYVRMLRESFPVYVKHEYPGNYGRSVELEHKIYVVPTMTWEYFQKLTKRMVTEFGLWALYAKPETKRSGVLKWVNRQLKAAYSPRRITTTNFTKDLMDGEIIRALVDHCRACLNPTTTFASKHFGRVASHGTPTAADENDVDEETLRSSKRSSDSGKDNKTLIEQSLAELPFALPSRLVFGAFEPLDRYAFMTEALRETSKIRNPWLNKKGRDEDDGFEDADSESEEWFSRTMIKPKQKRSNPNLFYGLKAFNCADQKYVCIQEDWRMIESLSRDSPTDGMNQWVCYKKDLVGSVGGSSLEVDASETTLEILGLEAGSIFRLLEIKQ